MAVGLSQSQDATPVWIAGGAGTGALGSDTNPINVTGGGAAPAAATATVTPVAASTSSVVLLAANASRRGPVSVYYDGTASLYVHEGASVATAANATVRLGASGLYLYEAPVNYTGEIRGIWSAATGAANVTERTA